MRHYPDPGDPSIALCGELVDAAAVGPECPDCEQFMLDLGLPEREAQ